MKFKELIKKNKKGAGIRPYLIGILLAGLFAFALIQGGALLAEHNQANQSITDNPALSGFKTNLESTLGEAQENANGSLNALGESPLTEVSGGLVVFTAISGVWKTLKAVPVTIYNLTFGLAKASVFGESFNVVFGIIGAIIIMTLIFFVIKMLTSGQDE